MEKNDIVRLKWFCSYAIGSPYWQNVDIYECDECETTFETEECVEEVEEGICQAECPRCHQILNMEEDAPEIV